MARYLMDEKDINAIALACAGHALFLVENHVDARKLSSSSIFAGIIKDMVKDMLKERALYKTTSKIK